MSSYDPHHPSFSRPYSTFTTGVQSQSQSQSQSGTRIPTAPYPPAPSQSSNGSGSGVIVRSSLSSAPHYANVGSVNVNSNANVSANANTMQSLQQQLQLHHQQQQQVRQSQQQLQPLQPASISQSQSRVAIRAFPHQHPSDHEPQLFAAINLQDEDLLQRAKHGAMLCEVRQLYFQSTLEQRLQGRMCQTQQTIVSRLSPQLGPSITATCLSWSPSPSRLATGLSTGNLCIHTFSEANSHNATTTASSLSSASQEQFSIGRNKRLATAVAWRPNITNHVALGLNMGGGGFTGPTGTAGQGPGGGSGNSNNNNNSTTSGGGGGGGPHVVARNKPRATDFGCLVWDVTQSTSSPLLKVCHNSAVTSLEWLQGGQTLAVGCQMRPLMLYDFRVSSSPPITVWEAESVHGMRANQFTLATFSKSTSAFGNNHNNTSNPIQLWDLRSLETPFAEIKLDHNQDPTTIEWSRPGVLSVAMDNRILHYNVTTSKPALVGQTYAPLPILDMAMLAPDQERFLVVLEDKSVIDVSKHTTAPLAVSKRDGRIVHAFEDHLWNMNHHPIRTSTINDDNDDDISIIMKTRAGGGDEGQRYSMDAVMNIDVLSTPSLEDDKIPNNKNLSLVELWRWIARMESHQQHQQQNIPTSNPTTTTPFPNMTLTDGGVWRLLEMDLQSSSSLVPDSLSSDDGTTTNSTAAVVVEAESLDLVFYDSNARRAALTACGWATTTGSDFQESTHNSNSGTNQILQECHERREFERAAALAVWHDNFAAAVQALDDGAALSEIHDSDQNSNDNDNNHSSLLQVISICIAGYSKINSNVWENACSRLLKRPDLQVDTKHSEGVAYLRALLQFLLARSDAERLSVILDDVKLSLCDRVGFACRFLRRNELKTQLHKWIVQCQEEGNVEGLLLTGLTLDGIKILQSFVDKTGDVQTASLVMCRVNMPLSWKVERRVCSEWLDSYRGLLNIWQMWQARAMFDVDRSELLKKLSQTTRQDSRMIGKPNAKQVDPDFVLAASNPGQLEARCNYCSVSLSGARKQDGITSQWLSRAKNVLSCCPRCRKPLPRCSICLLSLGCSNPYTELMNLGTANGVTSSLASLPFAEWFTWCMRCKHGGHAHHLVGWFANHDTCPVSGCDCQCQFDVNEKLTHQTSSKIDSKSEAHISRDGRLN
ncbi:Zinc-ribbon like family [Fragilaria crotonensis]|nr:Zinc-ribbon like family [Fragilaria crotonensis]